MNLYIPLQLSNNMANLQDLIAKASAVGSTEIPAGSGNSPEIQEALMQVFESNPNSFFRSKDLGVALVESGYQCNKVSDVLFAMRKAGKIGSPRKGIYCLDSEKQYRVREGKTTTNTEEDE